MTRKLARKNRGKPEALVPLSDFPVVYMSYDEPWADAVWDRLLKLRPDAKRVHGVAGLNACHVAAAEEAGAQWFLSVDADTVLFDNVADAAIPEAYLNPAFRLDWQSRNAINGIVSGNGSLKLWPRELVNNMRSHEAAPEDQVSLDADIGSIRPGISRLVLMPGCYSETNPARTPFHAFRAGFREMSFVSWLSRRMVETDAATSESLKQILTIWCTIGAHAVNGQWMLYGARMGLLAERVWQGWDIRSTHDYAWLHAFWSENVLPRIGTGGARCTLSGLAWNADRLVEEVAALGKVLGSASDIPMADLDEHTSRIMAEAQLFPATRAPESIDSLGRAFQKGRGIPANIQIAEALFQDAALLSYPSAISNLGRLHQLELLDAPDRTRAETLFRQAMALGCAYAPFHLATLLRESGDVEASEEDLAQLVDLSAERGFAPEEPAT